MSHPTVTPIIPISETCLVNHNFPCCRPGNCTQNAEGALARSRAADDFPAIRARIEELKRERARTTTDDDPGRRTDQEFRLSCAEVCLVEGQLKSEVRVR